MGSLLTQPLRSFTSSTDQDELVDPGLVGREYEAANGDVFKFVKSLDTITAGEVCKYDDTDATATAVEQGEAAKAAAGIAMASVVTGDHFYIQVAGLATPAMATAPTAEDLCFVTTAGEVESVAVASATNTQLGTLIGVALSATVVKLQGLR